MIEEWERTEAMAKGPYGSKKGKEYEVRSRRGDVMIKKFRHLSARLRAHRKLQLPVRRSLRGF